MIFKRIKVKLYPTIKQKEMLENHFDAYRYCYNLCLEYKSLLWKHHKINISGFAMQRELEKIRNETPFLFKCKAECVREAASCVYIAFKQFYQGKGYPKFKSKKDSQSFTAFTSIYSKNSKIIFYKNKIKYKTSQSYHKELENNKIKRITFKKDSCNDYWATCLIEIPSPTQLLDNGKDIGIDLGIKELIVTSDGEIIPNNKYLINSKFKLRRLQRKFSKTKKGGKNREKLRIKIAKLYRKTTRQKEYFYHQITNKLIRENQTIVMETLNVKGMMKNHILAKSISDASWGLITTMLEYKSNWYGRNLIKIDRWFPSSKTCSCCGNIKEDLTLKDRIYNCNKCLLSIDRDLNAAINIKNKGIKIPGLTTENSQNTEVDEVVIK